jgi:16S rRNA (cytosine967-C5)-methyltransferase
MHPAALLDIASELLREVGRLDMPADVIVSNFFRKHRELGPRERNALAETAYAVLRQRLLYQHLAQSGHGALERRLAILAWQGGDTLIRGGMGPHEQTWLNNVRSIDRNTYSEKLRHNLPDWLAGAIRTDLGEAGFWEFVAAMSGSAPLDLRVNMLKANRDRAQAQLHEAGIESIATPYSPWGLRVDGKPALQKTDVFLRGDVEVQDEGSQLLAAMVGARRGEMVVDFCAGAGGKTAIASTSSSRASRAAACPTSTRRS